MKLKNRLLPFIKELLIIFIGVFAAFWLNDYRNNQIKKSEETELYQIIYEDLDSFYESGTIDNKDGFVVFFKELLLGMDTMVENQDLPIGYNLIGDYWNIELINSMLTSGKLNNIDPEIFQDIARFHTVHKNFIDQISGFNSYYETQVLPNLDKGVDEFYNPETKKIKLKYERLLQYADFISGLAESSVYKANRLKGEIQSKYLKN